MRKIADILELERKKRNTKKRGPTFISFVKPGQNIQSKDVRP
jgi:hypothetical protein